MRIEYPGCPLCEGDGTAFHSETARERGALPTDMQWLQCQSCGHVYTRYYWSPAGLAELFSRVYRDQVFGGELDLQRQTWGGIITRLARHAPRGRWVDVGTGNGACVFTATEYGYDTVGLDMRPACVESLRKLGYQAEAVDALEYDYSCAAVVVLADVLEHVPYPKELLRKVRDAGAVFISCPNMDCVSWRYLDATGKNFYWTEMEHHHNFTRERLSELLVECGFKPVEYAVSTRYQACMEMIAV